MSRKVTFGLAAAAAVGLVGTSVQLAYAIQMPQGDQVATADDEAAPADAAAEGEAAAVDPALAELITEGEGVFASNCEACHGAEGEGGAGPALAGSQLLSSIGTIARQVLDGGERMPSFSQLSDHQIAAVATYIRNSWGNAFGIVTDEDIASWR